MSTLAELLSPRTRDQLGAEITTKIATAGRANRWIPGAATQDVVDALAQVLENYVAALVPVFAGANLIDYVCGLAPDLSPDLAELLAPWAPLVAEQRYGLTRDEATHTEGLLTFEVADGSGPYTLPAGTLVRLASGNRYALIDELELDVGPSTTEATVRSEYASDSAAGLVYADAAGLACELVEFRAGVTVTNPAPEVSPVTALGSGSGTMSVGGSPAGSHMVTVRVTAAGQTATALGEYSYDGAAYVAFELADGLSLGGASITFANGAGSPSWHVGDVRSVQWPGSWITVLGRDIETLASLAARCKARWPALAVVTDAATGQAVPVAPTASVLESLAIEAGRYVAGGQVTRAISIPDETIPNVARVIIAGQGGVLTSAAVADVQDYLERRAGLTDRVIVGSPTTRAVTIANLTIYARRAALTSAQAGVQRAIAALIAGTAINGRIEFEDVITAVRTVAGVTRIDAASMTINGASEDLALPVTPGAYELATWSQDAATAFTWVSV